jgi:hypothetical protein
MIQEIFGLVTLSSGLTFHVIGGALDMPVREYDLARSHPGQRRIVRISVGMATAIKGGKQCV